MVDSRQKGARAETAAKKILKEHTGLNWERTPGSGALAEQHGLKGDLYVPKEKNLYTVEVKHYKDCAIDHTLLTGKNPKLIEWWQQAVREANQNGNYPMLLFKHDRSKWFVAFDNLDPFEHGFRYLMYEDGDRTFFIAVLEEYLKHTKFDWIK